MGHGNIKRHGHGLTRGEELTYGIQAQKNDANERKQFTNERFDGLGGGVAYEFMYGFTIVVPCLLIYARGKKRPEYEVPEKPPQRHQYGCQAHGVARAYRPDHDKSTCCGGRPTECDHELSMNMTRHQV